MVGGVIRLRTLYINGKVAIDGKLNKTSILVENGFFTKIAPEIKPESPYETIDIGGMTVIPGLFDIHTHGAAGFDFNMASIEGMHVIMDFYLHNGLTSVLPTVMTDDIFTMTEQLKKIAILARSFPAIRGVNLEGPFLSPAHKGAMPEKFILEPDYELFQKLQKASNNMIRLITVAPETKGALDFIERVVKDGVTVSLGHSGASYNVTMEAIRRGAKSFTHAFNAMQPFNHHNPGIVGAMLTSDNYAEMILDGKHLDPNTVKMLVKTKGDKLLVITDSIMATGISDGHFHLGKAEIIVKNGDARMASDNSRAGSTVNPFKAMMNFCKFTGLPVEKASAYMSTHQARLLGFDDCIGQIKEGCRADFLLIEDCRLACTYVGGIRI